MLRTIILSQLLFCARAFHVLHTKAVRPTIAVARRSLQPLLAVPDEPSSLKDSDSSLRTKVPAQKLATVDDSSFEELVVAASAAGTPVLIDWYADWCGPCKLVEPLLAELHAKGEVTVLKADAQDAEEFLAWCKKQGRKFDVLALPTLILFDKGKPTKALVGRFTQAKLDTFVASVCRPPTGEGGIVVPTAMA